MNPDAEALWCRATRTLRTASVHVQDDPDSAVSRAYYAAFYAVSALFALQDRTFRKHSAVEAAVHRDLVRSGMWSEELGAAYSWLMNVRFTADYGAGSGAASRDADRALEQARLILHAVRDSKPEAFDEVEDKG